MKTPAPWPDAQRPRSSRPATHLAMRSCGARPPNWPSRTNHRLRRGQDGDEGSDARPLCRVRRGLGREVTDEPRLSPAGHRTLARYGRAAGRRAAGARSRSEAGPGNPFRRTAPRRLGPRRTSRASACTPPLGRSWHRPEELITQGRRGYTPTGLLSTDCMGCHAGGEGWRPRWVRQRTAGGKGRSWRRSQLRTFRKILAVLWP